MNESIKTKTKRCENMPQDQNQNYQNQNYGRDRKPNDTKYETLKSEKYEFGNKNWLAVERRRAIPKDGTPTEFISVSRGYYNRDGAPRTKVSLTIPDNILIKDFVVEKIKNI